MFWLISFKVCVSGLMMCLLFILASKENNAEAEILKGPSAEFIRHRVVRPTVHHARTKREIPTTKDTTGAHHSNLIVKVQIDGEELVLDLRLNEDLIPHDYVLRYQEGGRTVQRKPDKEELDLCQYHGSVAGEPGSRVAVSTCGGLRGVIFHNNTVKYIQPVAGNDIQSDHYIYDHADRRPVHRRCGSEPNVSTRPSPLKKYKRDTITQPDKFVRHKREIDAVKGPYGENERSRYVELVLVADHAHYLHCGSLEAVHHQLKDIANIINSVYSPLNIFIVLVGVEVWTQGDKIGLYSNSTKTLHNFMRYRYEELVHNIPNDNAHLITRQTFDESVVGKANIASMCTLEASGGIGTVDSSLTGLVAHTVAHEMGHNLGMHHDTGACRCVGGNCVMHSMRAEEFAPAQWSSCSVNYLAQSFERGLDSCLLNKPRRLFSPSCGNGFVEPGEQCDCGSAYNRETNACHQCCVPDTCKFRSNATCASGTCCDIPLRQRFREPGEQCDCGSAYNRETNACHQCCVPDTCKFRSNVTCVSGTCCDIQTCRPMSAGTVCRAAERECDLPEFCSGDSEFCPADVYKMDSTPCGNGEAYCAHGQCRSRTDQCRLLWGLSARNAPQKCYDTFNIIGSASGNCGAVRPTVLSERRFVRCAEADALCGALQCTHLERRLQYGPDIAITSHSQINNHVDLIHCRAAVIDMGISDADPGLVPDGAKCGKNKMCLKQRCVSIESVRSKVRSRESVCPSNCSGHGVCNSEGNCHCEAGFAPPLCETPGAGGSYNSGPATDPGVQWRVMVSLYVIFLGIIPLTALLLLLLCYWRRKAGNKSAVTHRPSASLRTTFSSRISRSSASLRHFVNNITGGNISQAVSNTKANRSTLSTDNEMVPQTKKAIVKSTATHVTENSNRQATSNSVSNVSKLSSDKNPTNDNKFVRKIRKEDIQIVSGLNVTPIISDQQLVNKIIPSGENNIKTFSRNIKKEDIKVVSNLDVKENMYANVTSVVGRQPVNKLVPSTGYKPNLLPQKGTINKEDIKIVNNTNRNVTPHKQPVNKLNNQTINDGMVVKPPIEPKPTNFNEGRSNVTELKKAFTSTPPSDFISEMKMKNASRIHNTSTK